MPIFKHTKNTRPILENSPKYIRSDVPTVITDGEKDWLLSNGVTTVIDLRTEKERERKHCPLMDDARFSYYFFPLTGGDAVPESPDRVAASYIAMVDVTFRGLMALLLTAKTGVLYFCNAGKDRTGVVSAALLYKLGIPHDAIVADYMVSKANLQEALNEFASKNPSVDIKIITPQARYIEDFLAWYQANGNE